MQKEEEVNVLKRILNDGHCEGLMCKDTCPFPHSLCMEIAWEDKDRSEKKKWIERRIMELETEDI